MGHTIQIPCSRWKLIGLQGHVTIIAAYEPVLSFCYYANLVHLFLTSSAVLSGVVCAIVA